MYKIMIADDEGITVEGLQYIISKNFEGQCSVEYAKTGREVIEKAETFRPDITFMDIHMPGINGIDAIREIKKTQPAIKFIILSAYDKFSYAKNAIELGVFKYLNKPIEKQQIVEVIKEAMSSIDRKREARSEDLKIREKLETVVPMIENGFIYDLLFRENNNTDIMNFKSILGIEQKYGYIIIFEFGESISGSSMTNIPGTTVILQREYSNIREIIAGEFQNAVSCNPLANKIVVYIPHEGAELDYRLRSVVVDKARSSADSLSARLGLEVRIGIGGIKTTKDMKESYREALGAIAITDRKVAHADDVSVNIIYEEDYPIMIEKNLFKSVEQGNTESALDEAGRFYEWMTECSNGNEYDIRLKVLEFVLRSEKIAHELSGTSYVFSSRSGYLPAVNSMKLDNELREWFLSKVKSAAVKVANTKKDKKGSVINRAIEFINKNYNSMLSLDDVSMEVDVTPYYFSRLFKEEMNIGFVEYVAKLRIEKAKELLNCSGMSMKEICLEVGYTDPNYFSRQFKKYEGVSPTEYREGLL